MKIQEIHDLIKLVSRTGVTEVEIEQKDFKITVKSEGKKKLSKSGEVELAQLQAQMPMAMPQVTVQAPPAAAPAAASPTAPAESKDESSKYVVIKSPMIGTFYRSSAPDKDP